MARSVEYWYDVIQAEKQSMSTLNALVPNVDSSQALLTDITTTSKVARWRLWAWCFAAGAYAMDVVFDLFKADVSAIVANSRYATLAWYVQKAKEFQYGDTLVFLNNQWQYATINPSAKIINLAAAVENSGGVLVKVAKLSAGTISTLTTPELTAFDAYLNGQKVKPAGVMVRCVSNPADQLQLFVDITYDPLVLSSTGELLSAPGTFPVINAVNAFIQNLPFNGSLELCDLEDSMQLAKGVISVYITQAKSRYGSNPFVVFTERYSTDAGYLQIDPGTPLTSSITYNANV